jgi:hypothetical protein
MTPERSRLLKIIGWNVVTLGVNVLFSYFIGLFTLMIYDKYGYWFKPSEKMPDILYLLSWSCVIGVHIGLVWSFISQFFCNLGARSFTQLFESIGSMKPENQAHIVCGPVLCAFGLVFLVIATLVTSWGAAAMITIEGLFTIIAVIIFVAFGTVAILCFGLVSMIPSYLCHSIAKLHLQTVPLLSLSFSSPVIYQNLLDGNP